MISLRNKSLGCHLLAFTTTLSTNSQAAPGGRRMYLKLLNSPIPRKLSWYDWSGSLRKSLVLKAGLVWPVRAALSLEYLMKAISNNYITLQFLRQHFHLGITRGWPQSLKRKTGKWDLHRETWKTSVYFWDSKGQTHIQDLYVCPGKTWEDPNLSYQTYFEAIHKQEVKAKTELQTAYWSIEVTPNTYREFLHRGWETFWFKEL